MFIMFAFFTCVYMKNAHAQDIVKQIMYRHAHTCLEKRPRT